MPQIFSIKPTEESWLGVWEITEPLAALTAAVALTEVDQSAITARRTVLKKQQFVAARVLLSALTGERPVIRYTVEGRPVPAGNSGAVSISHSDRFVAVAYSKGESIGVDIECMPRHALQKKRDFFLNETELGEFGSTAGLHGLHLAWSAKEAAYKFAGNPVADFRNEIRVHPFPVKDTGEITAEITAAGIVRAVGLQYWVTADFVLVVTKSR